MKSNLELVAFSKACLGRPYIFGTFGQKLTASLIDAKSKQYPRQLSATRVKKAKTQFIGQRSNDCIGLIKSFLWSNSANDDPIYNSAEDWSADDTFNRANEKGSIETMPDIPGLCVRYRGHVGVYIGGGEVIEARGFDYGTVKTAVNSRNWSHWYKHPLICYESNTGANTGELEHNTNEPITYEVKKGDTLSKIAANFGVSVNEIAAANNISNPNLIYPGQKLIINKNNPGNTAVGCILKVCTDYSPLNMRIKPGISGAIIGAIPKGAMVELIEKTTGDWFKVKYNGTICYCAAKYLKA